MNKYIKRSLIILSIVIVSAAVFINFTNVNFIKHYISESVSETLNRKLLLNGDLKLKLVPLPHLKINDIKFEDAVWSESDYMLEAKSISIALSLQALMSGDVEISNINLDGLKLNLERKDITRANWKFSKIKDVENKGKENKDSEVENPQIKSELKLPFNSNSKMSFSNIVINYKESNSNYKILINELVLNQTDNTAIKLDAVYKNLDIKVDLKTVKLDNLLALSKIPVEIEGDVGNISLKLKSDLPIKNLDESNVKLNFDVEMQDLSTLNKLASIALVEIGPYKLKGEFIRNKNTFTIDFEKTKVGDTKIDGKIQYISKAEKPEIISKIIIRDLDLNLIDKIKEDKKSQENKDKKTAELFSSDNLPFEYLDLYNIDVDIDVEGIKHKALEFEIFKLKANIVDSILNVERLYLKNDRDEEINARLRVNAISDIPELNLIIVTENIQLDKNDTLKEYLTGANTQLNLKVDSKGKSIQALMDNLNGQIIIKVGKGEVDDNLLKFISSNILTDLVKAINPIADKSEVTRLECAAIRFDIKDGVLTSDKGIAMQTDKIQIISSGIIDLHTQTLEFGIKPQARKGVELNLNSLATMVKLSGKITQPSITMSYKDSAIVYSYFATGGVTFLAKSLYDTATRDESPCKSAVLGPTEIH